ncbi:MAG: TolC family protein [Acidobacteria bacterium]|nr:TolC family protein [Acidobacteriota bacterium]
MKDRLSVLLTSALMMSLAPPAAAQDPSAPITLTLADAVELAQKASHRLAEARAREGGAVATVRVRQTADLPIVGVTGGYTRTNHVDEFGVRQADGSLRIIYPDIPDNRRARVFAQWPIYTGGRTGALERAAEAEAHAAGADLETARADLRLEVVRAYWGLATAVETGRVLEVALSRADAHLADVRSQFDAGLLPPNDVTSLEAQRSREEVQLIEARNLRESAAIELRRLTDLPADAPIEMAERLELSTAAAPVAATVTDALQRRPERRALTLRIEGASERQAAAAAGRRPTLNLAGGVDYARPNTRIFPLTDRWRTSWDVGVNASWTFWDSGRTDAEVAEAAFAATAARERLADFETMVAADVRQQILNVESSLAAVTASADGVRSAAEARRVVTERFNVGVATSTDVLDARVALLQAELDRTRALANARLAEARLDRAMGR